MTLAWIKALNGDVRRHELHRLTLAHYNHNQLQAWIFKSRLPFSLTLVELP